MDLRKDGISKPYVAYNVEAQALIIRQAQINGLLTRRIVRYTHVDEVEEYGLDWVIFAPGQVKILSHDCNQLVLGQMKRMDSLFLIRGTDVRSDFNFGRREFPIAAAYMSYKDVPLIRLYRSVGFNEDEFRKKSGIWLPW